jgi:succinate dehydrogenase/fumarate reductase flavoprotein subunit
MTEAEQLLIAAADLNQRADIATQLQKPVDMPAEVVHVVAYFLETCGRIVARAGSIAATGGPQALIEHAHDIARTHLGDLK